MLTEFEELLAQDYDDTEDAFDDPFGGLDDAYAPDQAPAAEASVGCLKIVGQLYKQALLALISTASVPFELLAIAFRSAFTISCFSSLLSIFCLRNHMLHLSFLFIYVPV